MVILSNLAFFPPLYWCVCVCVRACVCLCVYVRVRVCTYAFDCAYTVCLHMRVYIGIDADYLLSCGLAALCALFCQLNAL